MDLGMSGGTSPRLLTAKEAAAYFSLPVTRFERLRVGRACFGPMVRYDRHALDAYLNTISNLSTPHADNDAEAALDRFTARSAGSSRRT